MSKSKILFGVLIATGLATALTLHNSHKQKTEISSNISTSTTKDPMLAFSGNTDEPSSRPISLSNSAESSSKNSQRGLPTSQQLKSKYDPPEGVNLQDYVKELLERTKSDNTGVFDVKIAKAIEGCDTSPKNNEEWLASKKEIERQLLVRRGQESGSSETLAAIAAMYKIYETCVELNEIVSAKTSFEFYKSAADKQNGFAMVELAKASIPGYENLSSEEKADEQKKDASLLNRAVELCEPAALEAAAFRLDHPEYGALITPGETTPKVRQYGLFWAYQNYYVNNSSDTPNIKSYELSHRARDLAHYEIEAGIQYGKHLYDTACAKN